jgi:hypothetical protein
LLGGGDRAADARATTPQPSRTTTCRYELSTGSTFCRQETVVIRGGGCYQAGSRLYFEDHLDSSRTYRGDVVVPGSDGIARMGDYAAAIRQQSLLLSDSGVHAYSTGVLVDDPAC